MLQAIAHLFSPFLASCSCRLESTKVNLVKMLLLFAIGCSHADGAGHEKEDFGNQLLIDKVLIGGGTVLLDELPFKYRI